VFGGVGDVGNIDGRAEQPRVARAGWRRGVGRLASRVAATTLLLACAAGCGTDRTSARPDGAAAAGISLIDDAGQDVRLAAPASRIISLVPSATETLISIGAGDRIVARTRYDVAPEVAELPSVGGGVDPSIEAIVDLRPDLVIAWEGEKRQLVREKLLALGVPVFIVRTQDTVDIYREIRSLGHLTGRDSAAGAVAASVRHTLDSLRRVVADRPAPSVLYVVYNDPPMTAGPRSFIGQLISLAGGRSIFADSEQLWPTVAMEEIVRRDPDVLVIPMGEPMHNTVGRFQRLAGWRDLRAVREGRIVQVPADLMSRPSPSIAEAARILVEAFHPELAGRAEPRTGGAVATAVRSAPGAAPPDTAR